MPKYLLFVYLLCCPSAIWAFRNFNDVANNDSQKPMLEPINGTAIFRMHGRKGKDDKSWLIDREMRHIYCIREARCEPLKQKTCFGSSIPYSHTSLELTDSYSQEQTSETLFAYKAIQHVPKCWAAIQPFLCAVFLPKCEEIDGKPYVYVPSLEMCRKIEEPCKILYNSSYFPEFLKCDETLFPPKCNNDVREMKFNSTGQCLRPLVSAESSASFYKDVEGCGLQCKDPRFTDNEHDQIHHFIAWGVSICFFCNLFAILTFKIDWDIAKKYPAVSIFYINFSYFCVCIGYLGQFVPGWREEIVCKRDGTLKQSQPSGGENLSCVFNFFLVYFFLIKAMVWFIVFNYTWEMNYKTVGKMQERFKKTSYFHLIALSVPLILFIFIMALSEVDGDSVTGVCFVGHHNYTMRALFVLGPVLVTFVVGGFFLTRGIIFLICIKRKGRDIIPAGAKLKIQQTILRTTFRSLLVFCFMFGTFACHIIEFRNSPLWAESLKQYIICMISSTYTDDPKTCRMEYRPSVAMTQMHLLCFFGSGIVMSSWVWTHSTLEIWSRWFGRIMNGPETDGVCKEMPKHKIIRETYAKRKEFQKTGKIEIDIEDQHTDPAELNYDLNSAIGSCGFNSEWAKNLPHLMNRRGALVLATTSSSQGPRKSSVESEVSYSFRQFSIESRRNSIDSQVSVKSLVAEVKTKLTQRNRNKKGRISKRRNDFAAAADFTRRYSRKESSTSIESQSFIAQRTSLKQRRTGIGPMDAGQINKILAKGAMANFLANQGLTTSDDDVISDMGSMRLQNTNAPIDYPAITFHQESEIKRTTDCGRGSKNSKHSRSGKKTRSTRRNRKNSHSKMNSSTARRHQAEIQLEDDSFTSYDSDLGEVEPRIELQSSTFSGVSLGAKTNSRNSKRSCDVGIQANAQEIATQTMSSFEFNDKTMKNEENQDICNEFQTLLNSKRHVTPGIAMRKREPDYSLSETEKLKMLLLPSK